MLHDDGSICTNIFINGVIQTEVVINFVMDQVILWPLDVSGAEGKSAILPVFKELFGQNAADSRTQAPQPVFGSAAVQRGTPRDLYPWAPKALKPRLEKIIAGVDAFPVLLACGHVWGNMEILKVIDGYHTLPETLDALFCAQGVIYSATRCNHQC